ncbi:MAG: RNA 2',3'-cyclic phosphodiesterase [Candidatus Nealsonbacteria bacterium CG_4_10_14_0_2_um_filter_38_17]|uniref:RNA 2',3'-cyclic phosphodiesterase n=2 Tax=Candidatus Nealsoniibacteriota TaxID=1817911 RepID=A0A2M7UYS6_9BACT|nr:MAG: RNA 2',3'-cyclic phosphodiesterase [Candidatus Nealsonbacteria bacterium CG23_combo_of_CG06-09_8_20_14_all_38_19]PIZ89117.1 MAG: RNA 2',3'-cyclic phosphodiesterase [Candidatus Nealsonbacteria bacterium CG_4_10_14_0_2_um_filter_38_17]
MQRHRVFIAINLPENIKNRLVKYQEKWLDLPVRWTRKNNIHITLVFLGNIIDEELMEIFKVVENVASKHEFFSLNLTRICYGPPQKMPPRMVWVQGEQSEELGKLQKDLESSFFTPAPESPALKDGGEWKSSWAFGARFQPNRKEKLQPLGWRGFTSPLRSHLEPESRPYSPHITLGRIKEWEFRKIEPEERPDINEEIHLTFPVESIELMESKPERGGPSYTVLNSSKLKE